MRTIGAAAALALCAGAHGQLWLVESFENGSNGAAWGFLGGGGQVVEASGGYYSSAYVHAPALATPVPWFGTGNASTPFTGNYRALHVGQIAAAMIVQQSEQPVSDHHPALLLISFNGTPADPSDDWAAYTLTSTMLGAPGSWFMHNFYIPIDQTALPASWSILPLGANAPANPDWNVLAQNVDRLAFAFGDPAAAYPSQTWNVGVDYLFITTRNGCYPNCDGSTAPPYLNVLDFLCWLNKFAAQDPYANCDQSANQPVLNVLDFACFLMRFAAGCSGP